MVEFPKPQRLGQMFGWGENPIYQAFDKNRNAFIQGFANIGSNPMNPASGFSQGFAQGNLLDQSYAQDAEAKTQEEASKNATIEWLQSKGYNDLVQMAQATGDISAAWAEGLKRSQPGYGAEDLTANQRDFLFAQQNGYEGSFNDWVNAASGGEYGLTPIWGQLPDGSFAYGVQGKDGTFRRVDTGDMQPLDPRSLNYEKGFGSATGKSAGESAAAAPGDIASAQTALDLINQIRSSPELGWATGFSAGIGGNMVPGTGRYDFQNLVDQAKSGAFLTAVQEMRGLGALSNAEGGAATQAITRMNTATSTQAFLKALEDYERIVLNGLERARSRMGTMPSAAPSQGGGYTILGVE